MKKLLVALMLVAFAATAALAGDVVTYECKNGNVTFNHKAHEGYAGGCNNATCHGDAAPAKIEVTKDTAHKTLCKDCHTKMGGPTKCGDCHKK